MNASQEKIKEVNEIPRHLRSENYSLTAQECCRDSAKNLLSDKIMRSQKKTQDLQILFDMLPTTLTPQQDAALWSILNERL